MAGPLGATIVWPGEGNINADIVFVHGFGGDAFETWTSGSTFWPKDLLALDLQTARIITWGYDLGVRKATIHLMSIFAYSRHLLYVITRLRRDNVSRPLIFVCHSLGGLVVKETLIRSAARPHHGFESIYTSCKGVVFLGTPHQGTNETSLGELISRVAKLVLQEPNASFVHSLNEGSNFLEGQSESFVRLALAKDIPIACIDEGRLTAGRLIVPRPSASIRGHNVYTATIDADHIRICKFRDRSEDGYNIVLDIIESFIRKAVEQAIEAGVLKYASGKISEATTTRPSSGAIPLAFEATGQTFSPVSSSPSSEFLDSTFSANEESLVFSKITAPTGVSAEVSEQRKPGLSIIPTLSTARLEEDAGPLTSVGNDTVSVEGTDTSTVVAEYLVKVFREDEELSTLYQDICTGPQKLEQLSFLDNHLRLLEQFFLDAEAVADSPQEKAAVNFLRSKTRRQQISSLVYHSAAGYNSVMLNPEEQTDKLGIIERYLASLQNHLNSQDQTPGRIEGSEGSVGEDEEEQSDEDDEGEHPKMLNLESAVRFLTQGYACMAYKVRLRRLTQGLAPAETSFRQAIQAKEGKKAQVLLEEDNAALFRGKNYYLFRQLIDQGHSYESIVAELISWNASNAKTDYGTFLEMLLGRQLSSAEAVDKHVQEKSHTTVSARTSQETLLKQGSMPSAAATKTRLAQGGHTEASRLTISSFGGILLVFVFECLLISWVTGIMRPMIRAVLLLYLYAGQLPMTIFIDISAAVKALVTSIKARITCATTQILQPGCSRVTWICTCGRSYTRDLDVDGGLKALKMCKTFSEAGYHTILQASTNPSPDDGRTFQERHARPIQALNDALQSFESASGETGRSSGIQSLDQQLTARQQRHREINTNRQNSSGESHTNNTVKTISSSDTEEERSVPRKWLLFCFDHREIVSKMKHIRLSKDSSDLDLFPILRNKYYSYKTTTWMRWLGLTRFVPYLVDYDIKTASFVKFRLLPDLRSPNGMPSKLEDWQPDLHWNQGSEWEPAQIGDRPDIDTKWFLCHWAHPDEDWLRLWKSSTETLGDARARIGKAVSYVSVLWLTMSKKFRTRIETLSHVAFGQILSLWPRDHEARDDSEEPGRGRTSFDLNSVSIENPGEDCIVTILESTSKIEPKPRFLVKGPKKIHRRLKPGVDKPPHGWGLYITEEKKKHGVVFVMIFLFLITNVCLLGYVIPRGLFAMETMVLSACSLITTIVLFLNK